MSGLHNGENHDNRGPEYTFCEGVYDPIDSFPEIPALQYYETPSMSFDQFPSVEVVDFEQKVQITGDVNIYVVNGSNLRLPKQGEEIDTSELELANAVAELYMDTFSKPPWKQSFPKIENAFEYLSKYADENSRLILLQVKGKILGGFFLVVGTREHVVNDLISSINANYEIEGNNIPMNLCETGIPVVGTAELFVSKRALNQLLARDEFINEILSQRFDKRTISQSEISPIDNLVQSFFADQDNNINVTAKLRHDLYRFLVLLPTAMAMQCAVGYHDGLEVDGIGWTMNTPDSSMARNYELLCVKIPNILKYLDIFRSIGVKKIMGLDIRLAIERLSLVWAGNMSEVSNYNPEDETLGSERIMIGKLPLDILLRIYSDWNMYKMFVRGEGIPKFLSKKLFEFAYSQYGEIY